MGSSPAFLHDAFMRSPGHRENILGDYDYVGVGADRAPDGRLYVTVVFLKTHPAGAAVARNLAANPAQAPSWLRR